MEHQGITCIDLLRHGEAEGGVCFRGSTDHPLTAKGWTQMWTAVGTEVHWDRITTSPLARCADFARALARYRSIPLEINENLGELHFGAWEGRMVAELMAEHSEALTRFWQDPLSHPPPDAEPLTQLQSRILTVRNSVLARHPCEHILLITHGGPVRILLCHVLGKPLDRLLEIDVTHAALYRLCVRTTTSRSPTNAITRARAPEAVKRLRPFLVALQFLTRLPVHMPEPPDEREIGQSLLYYPLVGLLLGLMLAALAWAMRDGSSMLHAALLLAMWVLMTGGLHLDGLADSADAWVGGQGSRERTLAIMKDPYCGPAGAVALILLLLVKLAALEALAAQHQELPLVLAPLIGRTSLPALFISTPYVRLGGLGEVLARQCPRRPTVAVVFGTVATIPLTTGMHSLWSLASAFATFAVLRDLMLRRLGGTTGDPAGAMVELVESSVLIAAAMV